jgi:hypothetical protein
LAPVQGSQMCHRDGWSHKEKTGTGRRRSEDE